MYDTSKSFKVTGVSVGMGKRLTWPDDYFAIYGEVGFTNYALKNWAGYFSGFSNGTSKTINFKITLKRKPAPQTAKPFAELVFVEKRVSRGSALLRKSYAESGFAAVIAVVLRESYALLHICKAFYCFGEALNGLLGVAVRKAVADAVLDVPLQNDLAAAV